MNFGILIFSFLPIAGGAILALLLIAAVIYISQLKKQNKSLATSNKLADTIISNAHAYLFLVDETVGIRKTNYFRFGVSEELNDIRFGEILNCKNANDSGRCGLHEQCEGCPVRTEIGNLFRQKKGFKNVDVNLNLVLPTGEVKDHDINLSASYVEIDNKPYALVTVHEIRNSMGVEKYVRKANKEFSSAFDNIPVACAIYDKEGTIIEANEMFLEALGVNFKDAVVGRLNVFDNPCLSQEIKDKIKKGIPVADDIEINYSIISKGYVPSNNTSNRNFHLVVQYRKSDSGEIESFISIMVDNTLLYDMLKKNEAFKEMICYASEATRLGFCTVNLAGKDNIVTPEFMENLGVDTDQPIHKVLRELSQVHPDDKESLVDYLNKAQREACAPFFKEVRVMIGGDYRWVRLHFIQRTFKPEDNENILICVSFDIHNHKRIEEALKEEKENAISSDKMKSAYLANMSHEIRTPLNAIVGFADLMAYTTSEKDKKKYMDIIYHNNELLIQLINDILDLSKIEANTLEFNYADTELNALFIDIEQTTRFKNVKNKNVSINFIPGLPKCVIHTERTRISQVMNNFLANALKFTEKGTVTFGYEEHPDGILFYCRDTGCGIPKANLPTIFDRFVKLNNLKQGTGLGLAISHSIITKLGGTIGVDSEEGRGSTFWFKLPVTPLDVESKDALPTLSKKKAKADELLPGGIKKKKTLLVVEDILDNYKLYESILAEHYKLVHAWNGEEAIKCFLNNAPDAIIMDIRMPVCNGYEATQAIRQMSLTIPILAVTAYAYSEDRQNILASGFDGCLTKPVKGEQLLEVLKSLGA